MGNMSCVNMAYQGITNMRGQFIGSSKWFRSLSLYDWWSFFRVICGAWCANTLKHERRRLVWSVRVFPWIHQNEVGIFFYRASKVGDSSRRLKLASQIRWFYWGEPSNKLEDGRANCWKSDDQMVFQFKTKWWKCVSWVSSNWWLLYRLDPMVIYPPMEDPLSLEMLIMCKHQFEDSICLWWEGNDGKILQLIEKQLQYPMLVDVDINL